VPHVFLIVFCHLIFSFVFSIKLKRFAAKNFLNLPMHTARIPPVDPAPATIAAALAMHAGHICPSSELPSLRHHGELPASAGAHSPSAFSFRSLYAPVRSRHVQILMQAPNSR
jgi:hypothetical protein